jgi:hypothetical protein
VDDVADVSEDIDDKDEFDVFLMNAGRGNGSDNESRARSPSSFNCNSLAEVVTRVASLSWDESREGVLRIVLSEVRDDELFEDVKEVKERLEEDGDGDGDGD